MNDDYDYERFAELMERYYDEVRELNILEAFEDPDMWEVKKEKTIHVGGE